MSEWPTPRPGGQGRSFDPSRPLGPTWRTVIRRWIGSSPNLEVLIYRLGRKRIRGRDVLLVGAGEAQETGFWAPYRPAMIVPMDIVPAFGVERFVAADAAALPLRGASVDIVASINAFEHFSDPERVLVELLRVTRPGGYLLASFGPLWWGIGGDHFSSMRGGFQHAFAHVLMDEQEHRRFVDAMTIDGEDLIDGRFVGARGFLADGFFSKWRAEQYRELFADHLEIEHFRVLASPHVSEFRRLHSERAAAVEAAVGRAAMEANAIQVIGRVR